MVSLSGTLGLQDNFSYTTALIVINSGVHFERGECEHIFTCVQGLLIQCK